MRIVLVTLLALALSSLAAAADLSIVRVWPGYRAAESFERISEYFTGQENPAGEIVLRTQPSVRDGYYFLTRLKNSGPEIVGAQIELHVIAPTSPEPQAHRFTCLIPSGNKVFNIGLTGKDWANDADQNAVAWLIRVTDASGAELATAQSHLWSQPANGN
jgi:hypothetical protein